MASVDVSFVLEDQQVRKLFEQAPQAVSLRLKELIEGGAIDTQREMRIAANVGVTGNLRRSVRYTIAPSRLSAEIAPTSDYADELEHGGPPRHVSVAEGSSLRDWAKLKGLNPYALQASIARKGTKAHPFVEPTYEKMKPRVEADVTAGMTQLVEDLNNGKL